VSDKDSSDSDSERDSDTDTKDVESFKSNFVPLLCKLVNLMFLEQSVA
jgi:hypothetical protein